MSIPDGTVRWDARTSIPEWNPPMIGGSPWLVHTNDPLLLNMVLCRGAEARWNVWLALAHWSHEQVAELAVKFGAVGILQGTINAPCWTPIFRSSAKGDSRGDGLGIFTSGTTGEPKLALQAWERIRRPGEFAARRLPAACWLMTYNPVSYAGLQVFFAALASGGSVLYPPRGIDAAARAVISGQVGAVSGTPTWWRMLLAALPADAATPPLVQASLGGERVDQAVLDAIRARFRPQRLTHIYASTEAGSAIVVSDGREGFPATWLDQPTRAVRLRIVDGQLEINSPFRMRGYAHDADREDGSEWYRTPDLVEHRGDRVYFVGRADTVANIGGVKVVLEDVDRVLMDLGWFSDCRTYTRANPVTGMLLCADVVLAEGHSATIPMIKEALARILPRAAQPQLVKIVGALQVSANGKKIRS